MSAMVVSTVRRGVLLAQDASKTHMQHSCDQELGSNSGEHVLRASRLVACRKEQSLVFMMHCRWGIALTYGQKP
jgi:hypothetical protein